MLVGGDPHACLVLIVLGAALLCVGAVLWRFPKEIIVWRLAVFSRLPNWVQRANQVGSFGVPLARPTSSWMAYSRAQAALFIATGALLLYLGLFVRMGPVLNR